MKLKYSSFYNVSNIIFILAFCLGIFSGGNAILGTCSDLLLHLFLLLIICGSFLVIFENKINYIITNCTLFIVLFAFWVLSYINVNIKLNLICTQNAKLGVLTLGISAIIWTVKLITLKRIKYENLKMIFPVIIICIIYAILFCFNFNKWFQIDSYTYYLSIFNNKGTWNFSLSNLAPFTMGGHTSYAYAVLLYIGEYIWGSFGNGQRLINCIMSFATILAFYFICIKVWSKEKILRAIFLTIVFAVSPLFFGISYLISTDFPLLCFFTILVFATFYDNNYLKCIAGISVCFSKEIGFLVFGFWLLSETITKFFLNKRNGSKSLFFKYILNKKEMVLFSPLLLYCIIILGGDGGWIEILRNKLVASSSNISSLTSSQENTYIWWHYPLIKLFEGFVMNFAWLIFVLLIIMVITNIINKKNKQVLKMELKNKLIYYIPILGTYLAFIFIGIAYFTYVHYRYLQLGHLFYVLCIGMIIEQIEIKGWKKELLLIPLVILFGIESFITIDPVTFAILPKFNAGNRNLVSTRNYWYIITDEDTGAGYYWEATEDIMAEHYLADGSEYNREILKLQKALENAMKDIDYRANVLLIFRDFGGWTTNTCRQLFGMMDSEGWYWDSKNQTVVTYQTNLSLNIVSDDDNLDEIINSYDEIYYFDFPFNRYQNNEILEEFECIEFAEESNGSWSFKVYKILK